MEILHIIIYLELNGKNKSKLLSAFTDLKNHHPGVKSYTGNMIVIKFIIPVFKNFPVITKL